MVIVLGAPKTGTYTIHHALMCAGIVSAHGRIPGYPPLAVQIWSAYLERNQPLCYLPRHVQAIADCHLSSKRGCVWPLWDSDVLDTFTKQGYQFILNYRDPEDWLKSVKRWKDLHRKIVLSGVDNLTDWYVDYYTRCRLILQDEQLLEFEIGDNRREIEQFLDIKLPWWGRMNESR